MIYNSVIQYTCFINRQIPINVTDEFIDIVHILEVTVFSEPNMLVVFILSLLLAFPPTIIYVYLWTSVARFYDELKEYEEARAKLSKSTATMRLIGNLMIQQNFSIQQPNPNASLQKWTDSTILATNKDKQNTSIVSEDCE